MLLSKEIRIEVTEKNLRYHQRSNKNLVVGDIVSISLEQLSPNSGLKVDVKCDYCGDEFKMEYRKYLRGISIIKKSSCKKSTCSSQKVKESNQIKYGVENVMQLSENKDKAKQTNLERFGTENPNELDIFKNKIKQTNLDKWGVEHPMLLDKFKNKIKQSNITKYGTENPNELDI
jgi:hypothetical protein